MTENEKKSNTAEQRDPVVRGIEKVLSFLPKDLSADQQEKVAEIRTLLDQIEGKREIAKASSEDPRAAEPIEKGEVDLLLFGGQSNMQGETEGFPEDNEPVAGALEYRLLTKSLIPLMHPVGEDIPPEALLGAHKGYGSMAPYFCRSYVEATGHSVIAVHVSKGSTTVLQWQKGAHPRYDVMVEKIRGAIDAARAAGYRIGHIYFMWLQGESDALKHTAEDEYLRLLTALKNDLKADVGIEKFCIIRVGYFSKAHEYDEAIMRAQERAAADDADFVMLTRICATLSMDPAYLNPNVAGHYSNFGLRRIGETAGRALGMLISQ